MLNRFDMNLLAALDALLHEKNVTRAAQRVHVSQPTMSAALHRLREYFDDELLVQIGRKMELTPRAEGLHAAVRDLLLRIDSTIADQPVFEPNGSDRIFRRGRDNLERVRKRHLGRRGVKAIPEGRHDAPQEFGYSGSAAANPGAPSSEGIAMSVVRKSLVALAAVAVCAIAPLRAAAPETGQLKVTVEYKGPGTVDNSHQIFVWVFDTPDISASTEPISSDVITANGGAASFSWRYPQRQSASAVWRARARWLLTQTAPLGSTRATLWSTASSLQSQARSACP